MILTSQNIQKQIKEAKQVSYLLQETSNTTINLLLKNIAQSLVVNSKTIIKENQKDLAKMDVANPLYDRLLLNTKRIEAIAQSIKKVVKLPFPYGTQITKKNLNNGLLLEKITTPLGVVAAIFESRPNVVADIATLCLKSGNSCILKGSKDADFTNKAIVKLIHKELAQFKLPKQLVLLLPPNREVVDELFKATKYIDVIIPRGSNSLIQYVRQNSLVPVIETGAGVCHVYIHQAAKINMGVNIAVNAKTSRPSVCNAMDTLLVDEKIAELFLKQLAVQFEQKKVHILADAKALAILKDYPKITKATAQDFYAEHISLTCAIKVVTNIQQALQHIAEHGTKHSEAIVTEDKKVAAQFLKMVDAAAVYHNASTRFTDGEEFGLGAEVGISTQKLHARGPFALEKLVTEKWILKGNGQVR
jgi:glutamate-5-semialdehyde dehydrogenase